MKALLNKQKAKTLGIKAAGTLAIPAVFIVVLLIICAAGGKSIFPTESSFANFMSSAAVITITTIALSINLNSGRFDFSLGSMAVLSSVISAKITGAILHGGEGSAIVMLLLCIVFGAIIGAASGGLYVLLKIPPIITSLGVTLILEGITYTITKGSYVTDEVRNASMTAFSGNWYYSLLVIVAVLVLIIYLFDFTKFGYKYKALKEGQKVSVNTGIKEIPNAVVCYIICGALMGVVGFINASRSTLINGGSLNFGSIGIMFTAFLPMFIGGFIGRFSNDKLGYLLAGISMAFLNATFVVFANEVTSSTQSIINAVLLVVFLIYLSNEQICKDLVTGKLFKKWYLVIKTKLQDRKASKGV